MRLSSEGWQPTADLLPRNSMLSSSALSSEGPITSPSPPAKPPGSARGGARLRSEMAQSMLSLLSLNLTESQSPKASSVGPCTSHCAPCT
eukprot:scaffold82598_cov59-Phaeocystis_antarctica.AAC.3